MKNFRSILRVALLPVLATAAWLPAHAQTDQLNLDGNFGTRLEDAYPTAWRNREAQLSTRYERSRTNENVVELRPALELGILRNTQLSVGVPVRLGSGDRTGSGNIRLDALYNFNAESRYLPAIGVAGTAELPTGRDAHGTDLTGRLLLTKTVVGQHRLHLNAAYTRNNDPVPVAEAAPEPAERPDRWLLLAGYSGRISPQMVLIADFVREQLRERGAYGSTIEVGLRRQMNPRLVISAGATAGLGQDEDRWRGNLSFQHAF